MNKSLGIFLACFLTQISCSVINNTRNIIAATTSGLENLPGTMLYAGALGLIGVGIVYLLFGRKLIKIIIFIAGFLIFFFICFIILAGDKLRSTGSFNQNDIWMPLLVSILVGIGGGFIARCCVKLAVFLLGFAFGALVMFLVGAQDALAVLTLVGGILGGILSIWLYEKILVIQTSFTGATLIATGLSIFVHGGLFTVKMPEYNYIYTPLTIALALVGMWYQFKNQSPEDKDHAIYAITNDNSINIYIPPATK